MRTAETPFSFLALRSAGSAARFSSNLDVSPTRKAAKRSDWLMEGLLPGTPVATTVFAWRVTGNPRWCCVGRNSFDGDDFSKGESRKHRVHPERWWRKHHRQC